MDLVEAATRTNRRADAEAHLEALHRARVAEISPRLAVVTHAAEAMTAPATAKREYFERALSISHISRWPFEHARILLASRRIPPARAGHGRGSGPAGTSPRRLPCARRPTMGGEGGERAAGDRRRYGPVAGGCRRIADPAAVGDRPARRSGTDQQADRTASLSLSQDGCDPSLPALSQARDHVPRRAQRRAGGHRAAAQVGS
jgi:hypothetical protein